MRHFIVYYCVYYHYLSHTLAAYDLQVSLDLHIFPPAPGTVFNIEALPYTSS